MVDECVLYLSVRWPQWTFSGSFVLQRIPHFTTLYASGFILRDFEVLFNSEPKILMNFN